MLGNISYTTAELTYYGPFKAYEFQKSFKDIQCRFEEATKVEVNIIAKVGREIIKLMSEFF